MTPDQTLTLEGRPVLIYAAEGDTLSSPREALDVLGHAISRRAAWVLLPRARLPPGFFELQSGLAGDVVQKFANYEVSLAILGEVSEESEESSALSAFIRESNRGTRVWFVRDLSEFEARLRRLGAASEDTRPYRVRRADPLSSEDLDGLAQVLIDCVEGGASVGFMRPMSRQKALAFWGGVAASAARGERLVFVAEDAAGILGTVQVVFATPENQPHRADIAKMQVHRRARRHGVGAALLAAAEAGAKERGRTLLVLDTVTGSDGDRLYSAHGWRRVGEIPDYALLPDGGYCATTYFYKSLC